MTDQGSEILPPLDWYMSENTALRARVAKLEAGGEPNSYEARMDAYEKKIDELMARNAKLKAALKAARPHILAGSVLMQIDDALKDAPQ